MIYLNRFFCYYLFLQCVMLFCGCQKSRGINDSAMAGLNRQVDEREKFTPPPVQPDVMTTMLPTGERVEMVAVYGGNFWLGSDRGETEEKPQRLVYIDRFYVDRNEVTVGLYQQCVDAGVCQAPAEGQNCNWQVGGREDHPVNCVSWYDAQAFCQWSDKRLPTEAEWEKAARGIDGRLFPWGLDLPDCDRAVTGWGSLGCGEGGTWPVGSLPAGDSPYGARDMIGNVWEWVADAYEVDYYHRAPLENPVNMAQAPYRVLRGNSWYYSYPTMVSRVSNRYRFKPARWYPYIGFRCVKSEIDLPVTFDAPWSFDGLPSNWIERNEMARQLDGEPVFDTALREEEMVLIPRGRFMMGSVDGESDEVPVRNVYLDDYYIDKYEVTVAQYKKCVAAGVCPPPEKLWGAEGAYDENFCNAPRSDRDNHPVNCMRWWEADTFCKWAGKRLPTEAEWEKAARGTDGRRFPWGNEQANCDHAVIDDGGDGCGRDSTWPVGSIPEGASPYGVMDMAGNVWEWVADGYQHDYYAQGPDENPFNEVGVASVPGQSPGKILRGGSWADQTEIIHRAPNRLEYNPNTNPDYTIGFRCARDAQ